MNFAKAAAATTLLLSLSSGDSQEATDVQAETPPVEIKEEAPEEKKPERKERNYGPMMYAAADDQSPPDIN